MDTDVHSPEIGAVDAITSGVLVEFVGPGLVRAAFSSLSSADEWTAARRPEADVCVLFAWNWDEELPPLQAGAERPRIALLTDGKDVDLLQATRRGIVVLIDVRSPVEELTRGILAAAAGCSYCSSTLVPGLLEAMRGTVSFRKGQPLWRGLPDLTLRECEVALLAAKGCTDREIAATLHLSITTVKTHLCRVYGKLRIARRTQLHTFLPALHGVVSLADQQAMG